MIIQQLALRGLAPTSGSDLRFITNSDMPHCGELLVRQGYVYAPGGHIGESEYRWPYMGGKK